jgi:hypothetical protein
VSAFVTLAATGGMPPPSQELVRVFADGTVRALILTAWHDRAPADEAGVYEWRLDDVAPLVRLAERVDDDGSEISSDAGHFTLALGERRIRWSPFAPPGGALGELAARLGELRTQAREHPLAAVKLSLEAGEQLTFQFAALGEQPLELALPEAGLSVRVAPAPSPEGNGHVARPSDPPPLAWFDEAEAVPAPAAAPTQLNPGEALAASGELPEQSPARVDGFARLTLALPGEAPGLQAVLAAGPLMIG